MSETDYLFFVGIDLGSEQHRVCLLDPAGRSVAERSVEHGGQSLVEFLAWLAQATPGAESAQVAVVLEAPRGALVDALIERGYAVFSLNPKQLDRFRDRFSVAGAKDDHLDALVLADALRTDRRHFRRLRPDHPRVVAIRESSRAQQARQDDLRRCANQLWSYLQRYFPALLSLCHGADQPWLWDLLDRCQALPRRAATLPLDALEQLLHLHRIRRFSAPQLQELLAHPLPTAPGVEEALAEQVLLLLPHLNLWHQQIAQCSRRMDQWLDQLESDESFPEHRSLTILRSLPGVGRVCTATVLAEAFQPFQERNYHVLRALAGVAPVTQQSGKTRQVQMRRACNHRFRDALFHAANVHLQHDPRARLTYHQLRQRNHTHARALRGVADRLLELLCVLLTHQTLYDPARRLATPAA